MKHLFNFLFLFISLALHSQEIHYDVKTPKPQTHYANVTMKISNWKNKTIQVTMPSWTPGSYLMREFAKSVDQVTASSGDKSLGVQKIDKNTWEIQTKGVKNLTISYPVYCFELSVRTSFIDASHAYFNATSLLMYVEGEKETAGTIHYHKHDSFSKITTALPLKEGEVYTFKNYDHLADCPVEIGNHKTFEFEAANVPHTVAMYGEGNYDIAKLKKDMAKICETATAVFGQNPNQEYTFIIHNLTNGSGGLEHMNSTTLQVNRWTYEDDDYIGFLSLVAHEYFHLWNVKRLRPDVLGPFNYDRENYTNMLWVMEGFTSYYDELLLYRSGFYTKDEYLNKLFGTINYVESLPGKKVQPVAHASFDAWIKAYRPNENSRNTTISYYSKGSVVAALLDLKIIENSKGAKNLDDFLQEIYKITYGKNKSGFSESLFKSTLEKYTGNIDNFYDQYIFGTSEIPYSDFFDAFGLTIEKFENKNPYLGVYASNDDGRFIIKSVRSNGSAYEGGLNVNDEILAVDDWRFSNDILDEVMNSKSVGDNINFIVSRDLHILKIKFTLEVGKYAKFKVVDFEENELLNKWLKLN